MWLSFSQSQSDSDSLLPHQKSTHASRASSHLSPYRTHFDSRLYTQNSHLVKICFQNENKKTNNKAKKQNKTKPKIKNVMIFVLLTHQLPIFGVEELLMLWQHPIRHLQVPAEVVKNMSTCT